MRTPLQMRSLSMFTLEPLRAFHAVELTQARQVLGGLGALVGGEVFGGFQVCGDLVDVSVRC